MIKAIIFDFAGVVGTDGYWVWLKEHIPDLDTKKGSFLNLSEKVDVGEITEKEFVSFVSEKTGQPVKEIWPSVFNRIIINKHLLKLIKNLRKNYKIGLLSNFVSEWLNEILTRHRLHDYFDEILISSEHKMIKPTPQIFYKMLEMLKVQREEAIFIDDRQYNVDALKSLGIEVLLYTDFEKLQKELKEHGVKT